MSSVYASNTPGQPQQPQDLRTAIEGIPQRMPNACGNFRSIDGGAPMSTYAGAPSIPGSAPTSPGVPRSSGPTSVYLR